MKLGALQPEQHATVVEMYNKGIGGESIARILKVRTGGVRRYLESLGLKREKTDAIRARAKAGAMRDPDIGKEFL
jgi:DNA invertase Pin-like site-specific DNA recombinase